MERLRKYWKFTFINYLKKKTQEHNNYTWKIYYASEK